MYVDINLELYQL